MTNNTLVTSFDQLATETILDIFEYLSSNDIIYAFLDFNQRFNSILLQHQHVLNNFEMSTTSFYFWQDTLPIIGSQIQHLIITTNDFWFSLNLFSNLKSIVISSILPINLDQLDSILKNEQFNKLNLFKIKSKLFHEIDGCDELERILFKTIFHNDNSLQIFEYPLELSLHNFEGMDYLKANVNIHSLSLKLISFIDVLYLLEYTPNLKYFNLIVISFDKHRRLNKEFHLSNIKLEKFYFTYETDPEKSSIDKKDFLLLTNFIKQCSSSLICLSINLNRICIAETNEFQFNGILLQQQLLESMIKLKKFHLYVKLLKDPVDVKYLLSTFKNQFWFDHNWSIGMHGKYLYTLPFHFDKLDGFDHIVSSNSTILNSHFTWYHVKSIDLSQCSNLNSNLIKQMKLKMPNLISINGISSFCEDLELMKEYQIDTTLNNVTTVHCRYEFIDDLKQWLIYILPNVKRLVLSYNTNTLSFINFSLDRLYAKLSSSDSRSEWVTTDYAHFSNIKDMEIEFVVPYRDDLCANVLDPVKKILDIFKNSKTFIFHFYHDGSHSLNKPYTYMNKIIALLNMDNNLENYHMKHSYNYLQLIKKEQ